MVDCECRSARDGGVKRGRAVDCVGSSTLTLSGHETELTVTPSTLRDEKRCRHASYVCLDYVDSVMRQTRRSRVVHRQLLTMPCYSTRTYLVAPPLAAFIAAALFADDDMVLGHSMSLHHACCAGGATAAAVVVDCLQTTTREAPPSSAGRELSAVH